MSRGIRWFAGLTSALLALSFVVWPMEVDPVAFEAPAAPSPVPPDNRLAGVQRISLDGRTGPEDVVMGPDGTLYAAVFEGEVLRKKPNAPRWDTFVRTGGRPLGLVFDLHGNLLVADPYRGLLRVDPSGTIRTLIPARHLAPEGEASLCYANNVDVAPDGVIYVTDSTQRFCPPQHGGTFEASLLDISEHHTTGRLLAYDPVKARLDVVMDDLQFANGVAVSTDGHHAMVVETGNCRIWRVHLPTRAREIVVDAMPGYPDNLTRGEDGRFWVGFTKPRSGFLDQTAHRPWIRAIVARLPRALYPVPPTYSHVLAIDIDGVVLERHQDPAGGYPEATGVTETPDGLYVHSLTATELGLLPHERRVP